MTCPQPTHDRSTSLIDGVIVLVCRPCRLLKVEGSDQWVRGGGEAIATMRPIADKIIAERRAKAELEVAKDAAATKAVTEVMTSEWDERWERLL